MSGEDTNCREDDILCVSGTILGLNVVVVTSRLVVRAFKNLNWSLVRALRQ